MTIDTHQGYKRLIEAGVPEQQAEAHIAIIGEWIEHQLVTREYLDLRLAELESKLRQEMVDMQTSLRQEMVEMQSSLRQEMAEMERRLTNRMLTIIGLATAFLSVLMTVFKFLP